MTDVLSALIPAKWPARVVYWVLAGLHDRAVGQVHARYRAEGPALIPFVV